MTQLRTVCAYLLILTLGMVLVSCGRAEDKQLEQITIGTFSRAIDYSPFYVAKQFNWFKENPILNKYDIRYIEFNDRASISDALGTGALHAFFAAEPPAIITRAQGNDIRIVELSCTLQQEIIVRTNLPIKTVLDLRGKKVAVLRATSSHYGLLKILSASNLLPSDVDLQFMGPAQAKVAFETDQIDAWAVWPPFVEQQQVSGKGRVLPGGDAVIHSIMVVSTELLMDHEDIARSLVRVIQQAKVWIRENPEEAKSIVAKELELELEVIRTAWGKHDWAAQITDAVSADIGAKAKFLAEEGLTRGGKVLAIEKELIDTRFIPE